MPAVCFYFQVHQPFRVKRYPFFAIGNDPEYFNDQSGTSLDNRFICERVARKCYLPANQTMLRLLKQHPEFCISYSLSGTLLEQLAAFAPEVLDSFRALVNTGRVELLSETYYHSMAALNSPVEFQRQVERHRGILRDLFQVRPRIFRNTELVYRNDIAGMVEMMGFEAMLLEGAERLLGWRSPNFVYQSSVAHGLKLLLRNYRLSDDISFRFSNREWAEWPLTADKFAHWVDAANGDGTVINLFMDYETFGEHQWQETGIFQFLEHLPAAILRHPDNGFVTPSQAVLGDAVGTIDAPDCVSWADLERDLSAWTGNDMQRDAMRVIYSMEEEVRATGDAQLLDTWSRLQTSDHFYYMCTKWFADGDVHAYFNPYESPYEAYLAFMNAVQDLRLRVRDAERGEEVPAPSQKRVTPPSRRSTSLRS